MIRQMANLILIVHLDKWTPALQIRTVLLSIQLLMSAPNPNDPLVNDVANLWKSDETEALRQAKEWTEIYAKPTANQSSEI